MLRISDFYNTPFLVSLDFSRRIALINVMDNTLQQLLALVEKGTVEQRCAGLVVLAGLKMDGAQVAQAAAKALNDSNPVIKDYALRYFEEATPKAAVSSLVRVLEDPDRDMQERAVRLLSQFGQSAVQPLLHLLSTGSRASQLNAARVLCAVHGRAAWKGLLKLLLSGSDEFNKTVCDLMTPAMRESSEQEQDLLYDELESFAVALDVKERRPAIVSAIRLLGQLGRPQARRWLFKFIGPEQHPSVRSHALVALLHCLRHQDVRKDEHVKLFALLDEAEFTEVTRLTLELLDSHALPEDSRAVLSRLLASSHPEVQKFALRKMGDVSSPATVRTLIEQLGDADYRRREIAARSLRKITEARTALIKELIACADPSKAWSIAELLPSFDGRWRQEVLESLWDRLQAAVLAEDRIHKAFLHVLKQADAEYAYDQIAAHGSRLLKAKKYKEATVFLALLREFAEIKPENKFQAALAYLKIHSHTLAIQRQHPAVEILTELYRRSTYPLLEALRKEKSLAPDDLFALGFKLAERAGEERSLGKELLAHVAAKFPRNKAGRNAKNKLKLLSQ